MNKKRGQSPNPRLTGQKAWLRRQNNHTHWIHAMEVVLVFFHSEAAACVYDLFKEKSSCKILNWIISIRA